MLSTSSVSSGKNGVAITLWTPGRNVTGLSPLSESTHKQNLRARLRTASLPAGIVPVKRLSAAGGVPFFRENGVEVLIPPRSVSPEVALAEVRFTAHSEFFHHPPRGRVLGLAGRDDPMEPERLKPVPK